MHRYGCRLINRANEVAIDILGHEGNEGRRCLSDGYEGGIEGEICVNLIGGHTLDPEALAAAAYVPVGKLVNKALKHARSLGNLVCAEVLVGSLDGGIELREYPLVHNREGGLIKRVLGGIEAVYISVENVERIGVPESTHILSLSLDNCLTEEAVGKPGCGVGVEVPADSVCTVCLESLKGVNGVALGLRHLLSVLIEDVSEDENVLVGRAVKDKSGYRHKRVEPAARLVNTLGDKVCGELRLENLLVLEGIVPLCEGHRA